MFTLRNGILAITLITAVGIVGAINVGSQADKEPAKPKDIIEELQHNGNFKILLAALEDTKSTAMLREKGPMTFLAPTDEAFQKVPKLADLLHDQARLRAVLNDHLLQNRRIAAADLAQCRTLPMFGGRVVEISADGKKVDDARITLPDLDASNGVIHGIDRVLMENNDSKLRDAGEKLEDGIKYGAKKTYEGLKTGADKIKKAFETKDKGENTEKKDTEKKDTENKDVESKDPAEKIQQPAE